MWASMRGCRGEGGGQVKRNKQIYLPAPLSDYFAPAFCSRPYETQMSSEARASYRALSITSLCAPEALTPDYWLQHKGCLRHEPRRLRPADSQVFFFFFLKRNFIWQLMRGRLHRSRFGGERAGFMCVYGLSGLSRKGD